MNIFEQNSWVWIPHETKKYFPAQVITSFQKSSQGTVLTEEGEEIDIPPSLSSLLEECNPEALDSSIDDLVNISDLNEMAILHNLRCRYKENRIYTNISSILISVNPFKLLPIYTPEVLDLYRSGYRGKPPHIYGIAYNAYHDMQSEKCDQSVVISGESGAGKSEATKLILQFLTDVSVRTNSPDVAPVTSNALSFSSNPIVSNTEEKARAPTLSTLEQQILAANPILEAFGNAKTLRNNNSSRFGKLITVNFDNNGSIVGGSIINYLLEKSRVVNQTPGERNYHIFYQLLSAATTNPFLTEELKLLGPELFDFTGQSGVTHIDGVSDERDFEDVQNSFDILRFSKDEILQILRIVAGVLHFGNVKFRVEKKATEEDGCAIVNPEVVAHASKLWGVDASMMETFLCSRHIGTRSVILVGYNITQAQDARDAMVKRVYSELFQLIVNKINTVLSTGVVRNRFIGVLDIFGFESFEVNSFEQLCINYCNEKLQYHFNEHIFKMEQNLYQSEGIVLPMSSFVDNQPTLDLLEGKISGVFSMIDEEINVPKGNDDSLLQKILSKHADGKHPNLIRPKAKDCKIFLKNFGIHHYAGPVYYNVTNFLEKNKDQLHPDIVGVLAGTSSFMMQGMFPVTKEEATPAVRGRAPPPKSAKTKTLGGQFKTQLTDLVNTLNATQPHFVRCMKPNDEKVGNMFHSGRMQDQLRYAGLVEVCRIRKLGFPVRRSFDEFFERYRCIDLSVANFTALVGVLKGKTLLKEGMWAIGQTRLFMKTDQSLALEMAREAALFSVAKIIQKTARRYVCVMRYKNFLRILDMLRVALSSRDESRLVAAIDISIELPFRGAHVREIPKAKALLLRVREEKRVSQLLESAIVSRELNSLKSSLSTLRMMQPPFTTPLEDKAETIVKRLEQEIVVQSGLNSAISSRNLEKLSSFIGQAEAMNFSCNELVQAKSLKSRIEKENNLLERLTKATSSSDLDSLSHLLSECVEMGLDARPEVKAAENVKAKILADLAERAAEEERQRKEREAAAARRAAILASAKDMLFMGIKERNSSQLRAALENAIEVGFSGDEVGNARTLLVHLDLVEELSQQLSSAIVAVQVGKSVEVSERDLANLWKCILAIDEHKITAEECPQIREARNVHDEYKLQLQIQTDLNNAVKSKDREMLIQSIDDAENNELALPILTTARELLKTIEINLRAERAAAPTTIPSAMPATSATSATSASAPTTTSTAASSSTTSSTGTSVPHTPARRQSEIMSSMMSGDSAYDQAEQKRLRKQELSRQAKYEIKNYPGLRTLDDFARGAILNKSKIKEGFLLFQSNVIPKSLTDISKDLSKIALHIHKELLGYMGDKQMPFPAMLAQDILRKGFENKDLRDEIYLQIIKQLNGNVRPESVAKGWQMMCMCVGTFPPSYDFENYLLHFILDKRDRGRGAIVDYARYCLRSLEAMLGNGDATGFVPSESEISAYKDRPPILASLYLVDGSTITEDLPVTPDLNVGKIIEMCIGWLDLKDPRVDSLGIFVYDTGEIEDSRRGDNPFSDESLRDLPRTPRPLRNDDYLGDVLVQKARQKRSFKFVLKKKIFLHNKNWRGQDPFYERLVYLQAEDEAIIEGNLNVNEEENVAAMAAISMAVAFGEDMGASENELLEQEVEDFIIPSWREQLPYEHWAQMVLSYREEVMFQSTEDLQEQFLQFVYQSPQYGTHWFHVFRAAFSTTQPVPPHIRSLPTRIIIGFNADGLLICNMNREVVVTYPYADIYRWGGSSSQFSLIIADESVPDSFELMLLTTQAADMAAIILDYIRAIMAEQELEEQIEGVEEY